MAIIYHHANTSFSAACNVLACILILPHVITSILVRFIKTFSNIYDLTTGYTNNSVLAIILVKLGLKLQYKPRFSVCTVSNIAPSALIRVEEEV